MDNISYTKLKALKGHILQNLIESEFSDCNYRLKKQFYIF